MFKKAALALGLVAVFSGSAMAADGDVVTQTISVNAAIASGTFDVSPQTGAWPASVTLNYDAVNDDWDVYTITLDVTDYEESFAANLTSLAEITNGTEILDLDVTVGGVELTNAPQVISADGDGAATDAQQDVVVLEITSAATPSGTGTYSGNVDLYFSDTI